MATAEEILAFLEEVRDDLYTAVDELDWSRWRVQDSDDFPRAWGHEDFMAIDTENMPDDIDVDPERILDYQKPFRGMVALQRILELLADGIDQKGTP